MTDANGAATWLTYDAHDQITKIVDPLGGETIFTFLGARGAPPPRGGSTRCARSPQPQALDGNGNLLRLTAACGKTTTWTYDTMDRVATRTDPLDRTESFAYDLNGNLATWTDRKGQVTAYAYDATALSRRGAGAQ